MYRGKERINSSRGVNMNKSESITNLANALALFQGEVSNPINTATNPFFKSKYAPLNDVLSLVRPILSKNGLSIVQAPSGDGENVIVTTTLLHNSGEWIEFAPLVLKADKATAQGAGSAITYARRYAISSILGISSEDDDDGNHAETNVKDKDQNVKSNNGNKGKGSLTENQIKRLYAIGKSRDVDADSIHKSITKDYKKDSAKDLTKSEYDEICGRLEALPFSKDK